MKLYYKLFKEYKIIEDCIRDIQTGKFFYVKKQSNELLTIYSNILYDFNINVYNFLLRQDFDLSYVTYTLFINNKKVNVYDEQLTGLYNVIDNEYSRYKILLTVINSFLFLKKLSLLDLQERLEEFEVIKDREIDYISLNNLFDFYEVKYDYVQFCNELHERIFNIRKIVLTQQESL